MRNVRDAWPQHHSDALKDLVVGSYGSYAEITRRLNADLSTDYSRSSVIGRASRMGLPAVNPAPSKPRPVRSNVVVPFRPKPKVDVPPATEVEQLRLQCEEIIPLHDGSIVDLEPGRCRWPFGDEPPFLFCGHPSTTGSSYCLPHFCRSIGKGTESERNADKVLEAAAG